jgi:hypothetical protein
MVSVGFANPTLCITPTPGFPFYSRFLLYSQKSGNHPENNLAKFGYILDIKLDKIK